MAENADANRNEGQWVSAAQHGDRQAFGALVELHGRQVLRYLRNLCGSAADADDLAQETFYQAYRSLGSFRTGARFRPWLLTIAHRCWMHGCRRHRTVTVEYRETLNDVAVASEPVANEGSLEQVVRKGLAMLPEDQRLAFLLRFGEGLNLAEIAEMTGAKPATVRWRLFRARQALQQALKSWSR